jgi:hypothetical protein
MIRQAVHVADLPASFILLVISCSNSNPIGTRLAGRE